DGQIELDGFDGQPPYTYSINGGPFTANFTWVNRPSDFYIVAIRDANGCIYEEEVFLWEEDAPDIDGVNITPPGCGETTGSLTIDADGTGALEYAIQPPSILAWSSNPVFTNVMPGTITIWVRDMF